jgi:hypothetical protein
VSGDPLSPALQQFISRYVRSVEQIEILALVSATPGKSWTVTEVFRAIQSSEQSVTASLEAFVKEGFLISETPSQYRYSPSTADLGGGLAELVQAYHDRRVTIVEAIYKKPADAVQDFADAFKLRKEK